MQSSGTGKALVRKVICLAEVKDLTPGKEYEVLDACPTPDPRSFFLDIVDDKGKKITVFVTNIVCDERFHVM